MNRCACPCVCPVRTPRRYCYGCTKWPACVVLREPDGRAFRVEGKQLEAGKRV